MDIQQFVANGNTTEFSFSFIIAKGTLVNVYKTLVGNDVNETNDLLQNTDYNLAYTDDNADFTDGKITFNVAPANGDYITITPVLDGNTNIDFTAQNELSADNLNQALAKHTTPLNFSFELWKDRVTRYPINVKQDEISSYNTILPPLSDGGFWRRVGNTMFAQKYDDFVKEVTNSITTFNNDLEQVTISNQTGSTFSLSAFTSGDISQNTLDVFKNGLKLSITGDYTVDSTSNSITFVTALISTDTVYIIKPLIKESNTFMDTEGDNAIFTTKSKIANKNLTNIEFNTSTKVANKDMSNARLATETSQGVSRIATQSETDTGIVTNAFVTPATLKQYPGNFNLQLWEEQKSPIIIDTSGEGDHIVTLDLTNVTMNLNNNYTEVFDLSKKKYIYYSFCITFKSIPNTTSAAYIYRRINGINTMEISYKDIYASIGMKKTFCVNQILNVKGSSETFNIYKVNNDLSQQTDNRIHILGWV